MAYPYTKVGKTDIYIGEPGDRCFFCNRSLTGKDCIVESNFLICLALCPNCHAKKTRKRRL